MAASSKGDNIHKIGAIGDDGFFYITTKEGSHNMVTAHAWLRVILSKVEENYGEGVGVVVRIDNDLCHNQV